jgi:eukaryotic-like serine/threonine-protein kinase
MASPIRWANRPTAVYHIVSVVGGASSSPSPGSLIAGKYRLERILGEGGMGVVVAATHEHLDQRFALKFLSPLFATQTDVVQRFMREARAAVKIQSEHVARVMDVGVHDGAPYMVMEYLEGSDLAAIIADRGPIPFREAVGYLLEAGEAIAEAHSLGIVHRDVKPANLFLATKPNGKALIKVLDFGISKAPAGRSEANITKAATIVGSPSYMSPEQLVAASSVDVRSDIWSLGVVLYEMLAKKLPFDAPTMPELVGVILQRPHEPLGAARPDLPAALAAVVDRCLEKEPGKRHADIAELASALLPFAPPRNEDSVERIRYVLGQSTGVPQAPPAVAAVAPAGARTLSPLTSGAAPYNRRLLVAGPLLAVLLMGGGALLLVTRARQSTPLPPSPGAAVATATPSADPTAAQSTAAAPPTATVEGDHVTERAPAASQTSRKTSRPAPSSRPALPVPATAPPDAGPSCHLVTHIDENGDKYFTKECP